MNRRKTAFIALALVSAAFAGSALALDVGEVKDMLRANVPENVIINLAQSQGGFYLTEAEMNDLRAFGASENLVSALSFVPIPEDGPVVSTVLPSGSAAPPIVLGSGAVQARPAPAPAYAGDAPGTVVSPLAAASPTSLPALYDKEGWLVVSNRDYQTYFLQINVGDSRMFLSRSPNGGAQLDPGESVAFNVRREGYKLYGDNGNKLEVKIREGETTTLSLDPFGVVGNSGLNAVAVNRDRVRSEVLFNSYAPATVVVSPGPAVVYQPAPQVIVREPRPSFNFGFYYGGGRHGPRHGGHRRWR